MGTLRLPGPPARRRLFRLALAVCLIVVTTLALIPPGHEPLPVSDKVNHIAAFLVLAWLADHAYPRFSRGAGLWVALLGYGLLIEALQACIPYREASLGDLLADAVGLAAYLVLTRVLWAGLVRLLWRGRPQGRTESHTSFHLAPRPCTAPDYPQTKGG
jgi:VanZ family protein